MMHDPMVLEINPELDLVLDRIVPVPVDYVWMAWTTPEHLKKFFVPRPWQITHCELDARPGGIFSTTMRSPEGEEYPNSGCFLEVIPNRRLTWTSALKPGFRPAPPDPAGFHFTAILSLYPQGESTRYQAIAMHTRTEDRVAHEEMGFEHGWGTVVDQMVELYGK